MERNVIGLRWRTELHIHLAWLRLKRPPGLVNGAEVGGEAVCISERMLRDGQVAIVFGVHVEKEDMASLEMLRTSAGVTARNLSLYGYLAFSRRVSGVYGGQRNVFGEA
jgi:hypothetical protein